MSELESLRQEVAALRKEVAELRANQTVHHHHYHQQPVALPASPPWPGVSPFAPVPRPYYPDGPITTLSGQAIGIARQGGRTYAYNGGAGKPC